MADFEGLKTGIVALVVLGIILTVGILIAVEFQESNAVTKTQQYNRTLAPSSNRENMSATTEGYYLLPSLIINNKITTAEFTAYNVTAVGYQNASLPSTNYTLTCDSDGGNCLFNVTDRKSVV